MSTIALFLVWIAALAAVVAWPVLTGSPTLGDEMTRRTVWVALAFYAAAVWVMVALRPFDWRSATRRGRLARWCWTLGWAAFVIHVAVAFHFFHGWSHTAAVEHVRERSGVGEGVFVSYLFTVAWTADVAWWWLSPVSYAVRPVWMDRALHGFMAFMVVMATVVYEEGAIRWVAVATSGVMAARWASMRER